MEGFFAILILNQAPELAPPQNLMVGVRSDGYWILWEPSPTDSLITRYEVFRDGQFIGRAGIGKYEFVDKGVSGPHTYFVRAVGGSRYLKEVEIWGMRLPLLFWKEEGYAETKPITIAPLPGFTASHEWQGFGFGGYRLEWGFRPQGFVEVLRKGAVIVTLPPGTQSYTDPSATLGQADYTVRDVNSGMEIKPNIRARWFAVHFRGVKVSWNQVDQGFTLMRSSETREQDMKTVDRTPPEPIAQIKPGESTFTDRGASKEIAALLRSRSPMSTYRYYLVSEDGSRVFFSEPVRPQPFNFMKLPVLIFDILFACVFFGFLFAAKQGKRMFIRKIAGLEELDNAVGRSTEMGRPIVYVPGIGTIADIETIASLTILKHVAKKAAEYETVVIMPNFDPMVTAAAKEVIKEAYTEAGRPDLYNEDNVFYVASQQFAFAGAVSGLIVREKPGATFLIGYYAAESLVIAEAGYSVGAIQVAGTASVLQTPFFLAACDYVLIGEEEYAASAYLSHNALQMATLKAEDVFKATFVSFIVLFSLLVSLGVSFIFLS
ncbi:MAG: DUF6754 domain-containing protein [candidate division WOR-3 bacterium]